MKGEIEAAGPASHITVTLQLPPGNMSPDENVRSTRPSGWPAWICCVGWAGTVKSLSGVVAAYHGSRHPNCLSAMLHFAGATGVLLSDRTAGERRETVEIHGPELTGVLDLKADGKIWAAAPRSRACAGTR